MYMLDHHVHALNNLIIKAFNAVLPHHVHVCVKFRKKIAPIVSALHNAIFILSSFSTPPLMSQYKNGTCIDFAADL